MYKVTFLFIYAAFYWLCPCLAQSSTKRPPFKRLELTISSSYQKTDLNWSIAGNIAGEDPDVLSELIWKKLRGPAFDLQAKLNPFKVFYLEADYSHSFILDGSATDTDYSEDNRNSPVFSAALKSDKGYLEGFRVGSGYRLEKSGPFNLQSFLGYEQNTQKLSLTDNNPGSKLDSWYKSKWKGPYLKLESDITIYERLQMHISAIYRQVKYQAVADWNTIEEFQHPVSFRHRTKGYGLGMEARVIQRLGRTIDLILTGDISEWKTGAGVDEVFLANGSSGATRLNSVNYNQFGLGIGLGIKF